MAYLPPMNGGRINASIAGNTAGVSTIISNGTMALAGGNNITLSQNGSTISIVGPTPAVASINFSASNTSANLASVTFSNANGVSFGLNAGVITASHNALTSQSNQAVSGSNGSFTFQTLSFANSNGISFATGTQGIYASVGAGADGYNAAQFTNSTANSTMPIVWAGNSAGSGNVTMGLTGSTVTASASFNQSVQTQNMVSVNGSTGNISFTNGGNVSFGGNASAITASYSQTNQTLGFNIVGNTTVSSSSITQDARSLSVSGMGAVSVGLSGNMLQISAPTQSADTNGVQSLVVGGNTAGATASISSGQMTLAGGNNIVLSQNGNAVTISGTAMLDAGVMGASGGTTAGNTGSNTNGFYLYAGSNINLSQSTDANGASVIISGAAGGGGGVAISGGGTSYNTGTVNFSAAGGALTITSAAGQALNFSVPATSSLSATGAVSLSTNGQTISIGAPSQSNQQMSLYAAGANTFSSSSNTMNASALSFSGMGPVSLGMSNGSVQISAPNYGTVGNWEPTLLQYASLNATQAYIANTPYFFKLQPNGFVSATQLMQLVNQSLSVSSNSSYGGRITLSAGIYSANGSTLSLITQSSGTVTYQYTISGTTNSSLYSGVKGLSMPINAVMTPGNYWIGVMSNTALVNVGWFTLSNMVVSNSVPAYFNIMGQAATTSAGIQEAVGAYSTTLAALPSSAAMSNILQSNLQSTPMPYMIFKSKTY